MQMYILEKLERVIELQYIVRRVGLVELERRV